MCPNLLLLQLFHSRTHLWVLEEFEGVSYKVQYVLPNNIMLLITIDKFETNRMLVNVNKFKPYKYMESEVQNQEQ